MVPNARVRVGPRAATSQIFLDQRKSRQTRNQIPRRDARTGRCRIVVQSIWPCQRRDQYRRKSYRRGKISGDEVKIRVALEDHAKAEVTGKTAGNAEGARGHVKCLEIVKDPSSSRAIPAVSVSHPLAKGTHEAAIGSIDRKATRELMAHGLSPERAVDMIATGILR